MYVTRAFVLACGIILVITTMLAFWEGTRPGAELGVYDMFELLLVLAAVRFIAAAAAIAIALVALRAHLRLYVSAAVAALLVSTMAVVTDAWLPELMPWVAVLLIEGLVAAILGTVAGVRWRTVWVRSVRATHT